MNLQQTVDTEGKRMLTISNGPVAKKQRVDDQPSSKDESIIMTSHSQDDAAAMQENHCSPVALEGLPVPASRAVSSGSQQQGFGDGMHLYDTSVLQRQYASTSVLLNSSAKTKTHSIIVTEGIALSSANSIPITLLQPSSNSSMASNQQEPALEWKRLLSFPHSRRSYRYREFNLKFIQQCASSWALQPDLQRMIKEFNTTKDQEQLIQFSQRRDEFLEHLLGHLNELWAVVTGMSKTLLIERVCQRSSSAEHRQSSVNFVLRSKASFRDAHENKTLTLWIYNERKGVIALASLSLVHWWLKSADRRTCASVVFDPSVSPAASSNGSNFNLWRGFRISQKMALAAGSDLSSKQLKRAVQPFLDHIANIWCRGDADAYAYCMGWMASMIQQPWRKLGVAIVLQGEPGSGKGIIVTEFLAKMIGSHHFSHITGLDQICGQFNAPALATACLVFADEANCSGNKHHAARLKTLITESQHTIENKYVPSLSVKSYANYILSSNEDHVVELEHKDRRYFALQTENKFSGSQTTEKKSYFDQLLAVPVSLVAKYLYQFDISAFNPRQVPSTDSQRAQKLLTLQPSGVDTWLLRCIEKGDLPAGEVWDAVRVKSAVFEHYLTQAGAHPKPVETFWRKLQEIIPCRTTQKRSTVWDSESNSVQVVQLPSLEECKAAFRLHMADPGWAFQCDAPCAGEREPSPGSPHHHSVSSADQMEESHYQKEWDAAIAEASSSFAYRAPKCK